jgi:hypothetical protein
VCVGTGVFVAAGVFVGVAVGDGVVVGVNVGVFVAVFVGVAQMFTSCPLLASGATGVPLESPSRPST